MFFKAKVFYKVELCSFPAYVIYTKKGWSQKLYCGPVARIYCLLCGCGSCKL